LELWGPIPWQETAVLQRRLGQFPAQINREKISINREFLGGNKELPSKFTGRAFGYGALMRPSPISFARRKAADRCGQKAANDFDAFIVHHPAECVEVDSDQYKRAVAVCTVAGIDLADWMVRSGHALDWLKYSQGDYAAAQNEAKRAERGIWSGSFVESWRYRACRRTGGSPVSCSDQL
jgi:Staphylococcal nuclease homologue